jgi:hypothetical protein
MTRLAQGAAIVIVAALAAGLGPAWASGPAAAPVLAPSVLALPGARADAVLAMAPAAEAPEAQTSAGQGVPGGALRSLAVPGWGQVYQGHRDLGMAFGAVEAALITTLFVSIGQGHLRRGASEDTAELFAGIDLTARDDSYRRRVSDYRSSDEYNRLVVYRDAAALYYGDFENYNSYIEANSLTGDEAWSWESDESWGAYRQERRDSESAFQRARFAAAGMVVNRVASAITAAAMAKRHAGGQAAALGGDGLALGGLEWTVQPSGSLGIEHRLAWVRRF